VGESKADMHRILRLLDSLLPADKPRYLMGVGSPEDIVQCIALGIDMFDCVLATRLARNGAVFTPQGRLNLRNAQFRDDPRPIQADCSCYTCRTFSRAYLRHLIIAKEILAARLNTIHNLAFMLTLARNARHAILEDRFGAFRDAFLANYETANAQARHANCHAFRSSRTARP